MLNYMRENKRELMEKENSKKKINLPDDTPTASESGGEADQEKNIF